MTEELNLSELYSNFIRFNRRNKKPLFLIIIIGILGVVLYQNFKTPYYETQAICMSGISEYERQEQIEDLSQRTAIDLINHLQINVKNKDFVYLSNILNIDLDIAETIKKIEAEQLFQQDMNEKYYALNKFLINLTLYDNTKIFEVQEGIKYFFNNNNFVKNYHKRYIESNNRILSDIDNEIKLLGDIRIEGAGNSLDVSSVNIISSKDGRVVSNQIALLSNMREEIKTKNELLLPLSYVQEFSQVEKKEDDIFVWSLISVAISYILGLFVVSINEVK